MDDNMRERFLHWRNVETPCETCGASGKRWYASTSTWHGGLGGSSVTIDVCDKCWGSGDRDYPGANLRQLKDDILAAKHQNAIEFLKQELAIELDSVKKRLKELADLADAQARKRKLPAGENPFWWNREWEMLASLLRRLIA